MTQPRLLLGSYSVWIEVNTVHGDNLEFVLHRAEERNGKDYGFYSERLRLMVDEALALWHCGGASIEETQSYGSESLRLYYQTQDELEEALLLIEAAVESWVRTYRIEEMT